MPTQDDPFVTIEAQLAVLKWMLGICIALEAILLVKVFTS